MGSRRVVTRSYSGDGRSGFNNGDDVTGSSRASGLSYLSGVRPENSQSRHRYSQYWQSRSTLCSVMAHLTEETQPSFETTLKSRAVSETSNVKFICVVTGNPAPEVTWYKDDIQLDRYCGLPKYEVSRNGQNHSLHIYNCTLEDAAIYQASARNSKGIVSCSGVLEVGTMSEYKIHQQYFAKLKQKAENKRKELEAPKLWDKENHGPGRQEQLRTISPDRSQRKRRSPMEASFSEPSSIEEEGAEENISVPDSETEVRLQETTKDNSVPVTNGTASSISDGQPTKENGSNGLTYIYDSVQKTFSAQSPKAPFAKKKIKISNGVGDVNSDSQVEIVSESRGKNEEARVVTCQIDPSSSQATVDEAMEVDNSAPDNLQENNIGVLVLQERFQVEGIFQAPLNKDPSPEPFSALLPPVKAIRGVKRENYVVKEKSQNMESKEPKVEPGVEPKDIVQNVGANALISSEPNPSTSVTPLQVLNKSEVEVKTCPKDSIMEVDVKPLHKSLSLEPPQKPSPLEPTHKPSSLEPTHKLSSLEPTHKLSSLEPTHKPSSLEPPHKPSSLEPTHKPSSLEPTHKPSSLEPTHKLSSLEPTHKLSSLEPPNKPSSLEPTHKLSSLEPTHKPSSLEPTHKPSSLESTHKLSSLQPTHKLSSLEPTHKPSSLEPTHKPSSLESTHKLSSLEPTHKPSSLEPTHKPSSLESTHKLSSLESLQKHSPLKPPQKPSPLKPTHKPTTLEHPHKPSSLEPTHKPSPLKPPHKSSSVEPTHKSSSVEATHKPSPLKPINKPSSLIPQHKPSSLEPTHKPSLVEPQHKPSSLEPTHKLSLLEPTNKPSSLELTHKPSSGEPTHKLSSVEPQHKPSLLEPTHKPSSVEPTHKPSSVELPHKPSSLEATHKSSSVEPQHKPTLLKPQHKPSSMELSESIHSTLVNKSKVTVEDRATVGAGGLRWDTSINGAAAIMGSDSAVPSCDRGNGFPQHPCEQSRDQLSGKETSSSPKNASVSLPLPQAEVTQAHTQTERNEAPVNPEPLTTRSELDVRSLQQPPLRTEVTTDALQTPTLHNASRTAIDKMTPRTWGHSEGSMESHTAPFTETLKSPLESQGDSENSLGCNISPTLLPGQEEIAIKTVGGTKIQDEKIVDGTGGLRVQNDTFASSGENKTDVEMERTVNQLEKQNGNSSVMDVAGVEMVKKVAVLKTEKCLAVQKIDSPCMSLETIPDSSPITDTHSNPSAQKTNNSKDLPKSVVNVMSVAELLRAQLKAFNATLIGPETPVQNPVICFNAELQPTLPKSAAVQDNLSNPMIRMETELNKNSGKPKIGKETNNCSLSAGFDILSGPEEHRRDTETKLVKSSSIVSPVIETLTTEVDIPSISIRDECNTFENRNTNIEKENDCVMDTGQDVPLEHKPSMCLIGPESIQIDSVLLIQNHKMASGITPISVPPLKSFQEHKQVQGKTTDEIQSFQFVLPKVSSQDHQVSSCPPLLSSLSCDTEKHSYTKSLTNNTQAVQTVSDNCSKNTQPDTAMFVDQLEGHQHDMPQLISQKMQTLDSHVPTLGPETQEPEVSTIHLPCSKSKDIKVEDSKIDYSVSNTEESSLFQKGDSAPPLPSATPQELASGARRKIFIPKSKGDDADITPPPDSQSPREEVPKRNSRLSPETPSASPSSSRRSPLLQPPSGQGTPFPAERRSPLISRRKAASDAPKQMQEPAQTDDAKPEDKQTEKDKHNPFKAPQVIRKIRGEPFSDASGHLKLWCQFFNVLSDSTIKWYRDDVQIAEIKRSAGDETQVALAIAQTSSRDCGVYGCTIHNEYGTDSTDFLLSADILAGMFLREELEVGEEIEMTPLLFSKGLGDSGLWGSKFFGRIMMIENHIGEGCSHKTCRAKVIYGLEPVFESGTTCIIKVHNPIAYGAKEEGNLIEKNLAITQLECRIHNIAREYCKIFAAETRVIENFGPTLEVIPRYLMYRPANTIPHATVEADLTGVYLKYCFEDVTGRLIMRTGSEVELKCCALQHWVHQWTNGNLLLTHLEGVDTKITNVGISIQTKGYQGLAAMGNPKVFEQFVSQHQCNYYCGLLSLRVLKAVESLQTPIKPKGSRSPMLNRKITPGSSSPQTPRKATASPRVSRKSESEDSKAKNKCKTEESPKVVG